MNNLKITLSVLLVLVLSLSVFAGCQSTENKSAVSEESSISEVSDTSDVSDSVTEPETFDLSADLDEKGYYKNVKALDYATLFDYKSNKIEADVYAVSDDELDAKKAEMLSEFTESSNVTDRAVVDGDTVNIDYVGSVDGVEFEGGTTGGSGTDVTIGVTSYIDDFLEQLIGHTPGETFNVEVTFPEVYENNPDLASKDAVFVTTINHIVEEKEPELTDAFITENFSAEGWKTVDEFNSGVKKSMEDELIVTHIRDQLNTEVTYKDPPAEVVTYQENSFVRVYTDYATSYGMDIESFVQQMMGAESMESLLESEHESIVSRANYTLAIQAVAETENISVNEDDLKDYFIKNFDNEDYTEYEGMYGKNYLIQTVLMDKVINFLKDSATI